MIYVQEVPCNEKAVLHAFKGTVVGVVKMNIPYVITCQSDFEILFMARP